MGDSSQQLVEEESWFSSPERWPITPSFSLLYGESVKSATGIELPYKDKCIICPVPNGTQLYGEGVQCAINDDECHGKRRHGGSEGSNLAPPELETLRTHGGNRRHYRREK